MSEPSKASSFFFNLLVFAPAVVFSVFIGGSGLTLLGGSFKQTRPVAPTSTASPVETGVASSPLAAPHETTMAAGNAEPSFETLMAEGQKVYTTVCIACHQPTGQGLPNMFPPLAGSDWVISEDPGCSIAIVLHGLNGPVPINGTPFTTMMVMPPQGPMLKDEQIAAALTFTRNSWGNKASPVKPSQVAAIRERTKDRTQVWTAPELSEAFHRKHAAETHQP